MTWKSLRSSEIRRRSRIAFKCGPRTYARLFAGKRNPSASDLDLPSNSLAHDLEISQIERDQKKITNCFQMWAADVCSSLRRKAEPLGFRSGLAEQLLSS